MKPRRAIWVCLVVYATCVVPFLVQSSIPVRVFPSPVGSSQVRDPLIKVFIRDFDAHVVPSSVRLFLESREVTPLVMELTPLVITDRTDGVEVEYRVRDLLLVGSTQTVTVTYSDDVFPPVTLTNTWTFRAGPLTRDTLFIEAEDFNYSNDGVTGGLHADFGAPECSLQGKDAVRFVDYFESDDSNLQPNYRPTGVETVREDIDNLRGERTLTCDYVVRSDHAGDWRNYTRVFLVYERAFFVYLRAASASGSRVRLDRIEGAVATNQSVTSLGTFEIPPSLNSNLFDFYPLRVEGQTFPLMRVCGETTLRLTVVEGNPDLNYLALVPMSGTHERTRLGSIYPLWNDLARAPLIKVELYDWESAVIPSSIRLFLDCMEVTAGATITDLPYGATITYQAPTGSPLGARHEVHVQWDDTRHCGLPPNDESWSYLEGPYNPNMNLFIEAEDFDTAGGNYFPSNPATTNDFNRKGLYQGVSATHDIDYHFQPQTGVPPVGYRPGLNPEVAMREAADAGVGERPGFGTTVDYRIGWNAPGNWYNYTRNWSTTGEFNVYLRASHGITNTIVNGDLSIVHTNGTTQSLGTFSGPSTGNWDLFGFIPLRDSGGDFVSVQLGGQRTLRYTVLPGSGTAPFAADLNYLMFVPVESEEFPHPFVGVRRCDIDGLLQLSFAGALQSANAITGPWETVNGAFSPLVIQGTNAAQKFWRVAPPP